MNKPFFFDIPTAAELAGTSIKQFRRIITMNRFHVYVIGRRHFILARDLESWLIRQHPLKGSAEFDAKVAE